MLFLRFYLSLRVMKIFRIIYYFYLGLDKWWVLKDWIIMVEIEDISNLKYEIMGLMVDMKFGDELIRGKIDRIEILVVKIFIFYLKFKGFI